MLPPYTPEEVAEAVAAQLAAAAQELAELTVTASDPAREWRVEARLADGRRIHARYPFSAPEGIVVPAEIADWFAALVAEGG